ncbi:MAG: LLM class flavin-dependent oxidoreductase [Proteobacteria bacterium]|nr:LLM class flavin-dependent oxidoreductase [Pseudomonadota bacterium]
MKFGITVSQIKEVDLDVRADQLGYDFCWVWDSPMIRSNLWALLALVADRTNRIAVGSGVAIPALSLAPVIANAIATINAIAPGRTFLGLGTGNTGLRAMGQTPMTIAAFEQHVRVIRGLLCGQTVSFEANGICEDIVFQSLALEHINLDDPIPIHIGGFGPRAQALAGEYGEGPITGIPRGGSIPDALANVKIGADRAGRRLEKFETYALVNLLLLRPGETLTSARVLNEVGSSIMVNIHFMYDRYRKLGTPPPDYAQPIWEQYVAFRKARDAERSFTQAHESHYGHLDPAEARFITPEIIRAFCIAGQPDEIVDQLRVLEAQGLTGINFIAPAERQYTMCDEFADTVLAMMR